MFTNIVASQHLRTVEHRRADEGRAKKHPDEIYYSLYTNLCSDPERIKNYLDGDILESMIKRHMARCHDPKAKANLKRPGYVVVLLGACAMSLGCSLPTDFFEHLRATYAHSTRVGLMRDAASQMSKALFGPGGYTNGIPYDFGNKGFDATVASGGPPLADRYFESMLNVPSPSGVLPQELLAQALVMGKCPGFKVTEQYLREKFEMSKGEKKAYGDDQCGWCGVKEGPEGKVLMQCVRCKGRRYCGKDCQKKDWPEHKAGCKAQQQQ